MIQKLLICDSQGYPFYSRDFDNEIPKVDQALLSGLISTIGTLGRQLFKKDIANISFGSGYDEAHIFIVTKEILFKQKSIYFIFFMKGQCDVKLVKDISTTIFIENKNILKNSDQFSIQIEQKVDAIINHKFNGLKEC
ncbi:MAG: hypothetical protein GF317_17000 [Candidatus Lokiarchaeota archaeon]|nr:hypothetical protein [Candidatus Lokiarchaeota archaeon]MBD3201217.1 hypothetical protein [Candidatus Lokiarchaeota archaeon]